MRSESCCSGFSSHGGADVGYSRNPLARPTQRNPRASGSVSDRACLGFRLGHTRCRQSPPLGKKRTPRRPSPSTGMDCAQAFALSHRNLPRTISRTFGNRENCGMLAGEFEIGVRRMKFQHLRQINRAEECGIANAIDADKFWNAFALGLKIIVAILFCWLWRPPYAAGWIARKLFPTFSLD